MGNRLEIINDQQNSDLISAIGREVHPAHGDVFARPLQLFRDRRSDMVKVNLRKLRACVVSSNDFNLRIR